MKKTSVPHILTINAGSSSIRFTVYEVARPVRRLLDGKIDRIGLSGTTMSVNGEKDKGLSHPLPASNHLSAVAFLLDWIESQPFSSSIKAVGHRIVHGMTHSEPLRVTPRLLGELRRSLLEWAE